MGHLYALYPLLLERGRETWKHRSTLGSSSTLDAKKSPNLFGIFLHAFDLLNVQVAFVVVDSDIIMWKRIFT